jgi:hypothetical protein
MKKAVIFLFAGFIISIQSYSQKNEYIYPTLKFGMSHGINPSPLFNANKYVYTPDGQMQVNPTGSAYVPGFVFAFLYNFDYSSKSGIYTGIEYNYSGIGGKYKTNYGDYTMTETNRYHSLGIPLALKFGDILDKQLYGFVGGQVNMLLTMSAVEKTNWAGGSSSETLSSGAFNKVGLNLFCGINVSAFNIELDYFPNSLFNAKYISDSGYKINLGKPEHSFVLKTTISVPYGWLSRTSFFWRKVLRKTFWK